MERIESVLVPEIEWMGRRRLLDEESTQYCPGVRTNDSVTMGTVLEIDINGWLDGEADPDQTPKLVVSLRGAALALYGEGADEMISEKAGETPAWVDEI